MRPSAAILRVCAFLMLFACKAKEQPDDNRAKVAATTTSSSSSAPAASISAVAPSASVQATIVDDAAVPDVRSAKSVSREVRVSSRSDDPKASPLAMFDGDDSTVWSPAAGDTAPTITFEIRPEKTKMHAILLASTGVLEVKVTWKPRADHKNEYGVTYIGYGADQTLAERVALDATAKGAQRVGVETTGNGIVTLTILKSASGSAVAVRELNIETDSGMVLRPLDMVVGDGKPRGISAIVPESPLAFECVAAVNDPPRAYCFNGAWNSVMPLLRRAAFVMIDATGAHALRTLTFDVVAEEVSNMPRRYLKWEDWLAVEKTLRDAGAVTLEKRRSKVPAGAVDVPWGKTASAVGATLRQRETSARPDGFAGVGAMLRSGVLEVQWPGAAAFTSVMSDESSLGGASAFARPLGSAWLVERSGEAARNPGSDGIEAVSVNEARAFGDASLCDPVAKKCTTPFASGP